MLREENSSSLTQFSRFCVIWLSSYLQPHLSPRPLFHPMFWSSSSQLWLHMKVTWEAFKNTRGWTSSKTNYPRTSGSRALPDCSWVSAAHHTLSCLSSFAQALSFAWNTSPPICHLADSFILEASPAALCCPPRSPPRAQYFHLGLSVLSHVRPDRPPCIFPLAVASSVTLCNSCLYRHSDFEL